MKKLWTVFVAGAVLALPALALAADPTDQLLDLAEMHMRHRGWESAVGYYDKVLEKHPDNIHALVGRLEAALKAGQDVLAEYEQQYAAEPENPVAAVLFARLLRPDKALAILKKVEEQSWFLSLGRARANLALGSKEASGDLTMAAANCPEEPRALSMVAGYFEQAERLDRADDLYGQARKLAPDSIDAMVGHGNVLRLMGKLDEAVALLQKAEAQDKEDPEVLYRMALCYLDRGDLDLAIRTAGAALAIAAEDVDVLLLHGDAQFAKENLEEAERGYRKAVELAPRRVDAHRRLGYVLDLQDKNDEALDEYREILKIDPLNAPARTSIGWILIKKGKYDEATKELRQAADMDESEPAPLFFQGYIHDLMGRWGEAVEVYEKLIRKFPDYARGHNNLGLDHDLLGKSSKALKSLEKAVELDPDEPEYLLNLANAYYNAKKYKEAANCFLDLIDFAPDLVPAWTGLARCHRQLRNYKDCVEAYEKALEVNPEDAETHLIAGIVYQENLKDYARALLHYEEYIRLGGQDPVVEKWIEECRSKVK